MCTSGFIFLQWPHQGARNLTNADLPASAEFQLSSVSSSAPWAVARSRTGSRARRNRHGAATVKRAACLGKTEGGRRQHMGGGAWLDWQKKPSNKLAPAPRGAARARPTHNTTRRRRGPDQFGTASAPATPKVACSGRQQRAGSGRPGRRRPSTCMDARASVAADASAAATASPASASLSASREAAARQCAPAGRWTPRAPARRRRGAGAPPSGPAESSAAAAAPLPSQAPTAAAALCAACVRSGRRWRRRRRALLHRLAPRPRRLWSPRRSHWAALRSQVPTFGVMCMVRVFHVLPDAWTTALGECASLPSTPQGLLVRVAAAALIVPSPMRGEVRDEWGSLRQGGGRWRAAETAHVTALATADRSAACEEEAACSLAAV